MCLFPVPGRPCSVLQLPHQTGTDKAGPVEGAKSKLFLLELLRTNSNIKPPYHQYSINCTIVFHCLILEPPSTPPPCQPEHEPILSSCDLLKCSVRTRRCWCPSPRTVGVCCARYKSTNSTYTGLQGIDTSKRVFSILVTSAYA